MPNYTKPWLNHHAPAQSSISRIIVHCAQTTYLKYAHFTFLFDKSLAFLLPKQLPTKSLNMFKISMENKNSLENEYVLFSKFQIWNIRAG